MRSIVMFILFVSLAYHIFSQEQENCEKVKDSTENTVFCYRYCVSEESLSTINTSELSDHFLGVGIARKFYLLKDTYTYTEHPSPTSPGEKTIIIKPSIYNSLLKLNRYYKKQLKHGEISAEEASEKLNHYLDIALSVFIEDTDSFEDKLRKAKGPDEISNVFSMVVLK